MPRHSQADAPLAQRGWTSQRRCRGPNSALCAWAWACAWACTWTWVETPHGNQPIERAMNRLSDVERPVNQKIVARESRAKGWTTKSEALTADPA